MDHEENYWNHNVKGDAVEGPVVCVYLVVFILRRMQEGFHAKGKILYMCFFGSREIF